MFIISASIFKNDITKRNPKNYVYDANGNLTADIGKKITSIEYGRANLQKKMTMDLREDVVVSGRTFETEAEVKAKADISTSSTVTIEDSADVEFRAGSEITLSAGFSVEAGGKFSAVVDAALQTETEGDIINYVYDAGGQRVKKQNSIGKESYYINGANGETIAFYDETGDLQFVNIYGSDVIGKYVPDNETSEHLTPRAKQKSLRPNKISKLERNSVKISYNKK
ncbi:hypothetical protein KJ742_02760 [Patescibacteria group bacterium]|nr:hypothetical protein [Patescibacteria group bacterium]